MWDNFRALLEKNLPRPPSSATLVAYGSEATHKPHICETNQIAHYVVDIISLGPIKYSYDS